MPSYFSFRISRVAAALLAAVVTYPAAAAYQYRLYLPGFVGGPVTPAATPTPPVVLPAEEIVAALAATALPAGEVNQSYSYDLNQLLSVTGDSAYSASDVGWNVASGALPPGLNLGGNGVIAGTPTTKNTLGSSFQVLATYKAQSGQQAYTIVVNGVVLHVIQIVAGQSHTCAVTAAGGAKCWGYNGNSTLGDGTSTDRTTPVDVSGLTNSVTSISAGSSHTCAVTTASSAKCWGINNNGQLGDSTTANRATPVDVTP